nr:methyl-accepting chemotaxis protein [Paraburkholderia phosphatilytica]
MGASHDHARGPQGHARYRARRGQSRDRRVQGEGGREPDAARGRAEGGARRTRPDALRQGRLHFRRDHRTGDTAEPHAAADGRQVRRRPEGFEGQPDLLRDPGRGYVHTNTPKPGEKTDSAKLSAVRAVSGWNWVIGTGAYIDDIDAAFYRALVVQGLEVLLAGGLASLLAAWIIRSLSREIGGDPAHAREAAFEIAQGNLAARFDVGHADETSLLFSIGQMQTQLSHTIGTIKTSVSAIADATRQIAAGNMDLSSRTEQQAASLQETAASMEQLTATVKQNSDNAQHASGFANEARSVANEGSAIVGDVVKTMAEINESADRMAEIISMIEGVAFQTNILALNAAVEAARAGEHGRGFAVVASEVRSLAQRSASAAKEIKALIETSGARVQTGSELVTRAGETMHRIESSIERVTAIMTEIAAASHEQSRGIEQVGLAVAQMDEVTQQNAALVEEAAASAGALEDQTDQLRSAIDVFHVA